mmetsp:Transcript_4816/g.8988  ORF Transcript_4816/g.8988 Transcript_4816/m.8988 type:complete len:115 (-) Transcript_4816:494-838(-)
MKCTQIFRTFLTCVFTPQQSTEELTVPQSISLSKLPLTENVQISPSLEEGKRRSSVRRQLNIYEGPPLIVLHDAENNTSVLYSSNPVKPSKPRKKRDSHKKKRKRKRSKGPEME